MTIYSYSFNKEDPIKQGDIFIKIPYLSLSYLFRFNTNGEHSVENEAKKLIYEVIERDRDIVVETILSSTVCILMSQDCDIENEEDLIFLPLVINKHQNNYKVIKKSLSNESREVYLPKLKSPNLQPVGPFKIKFSEPFKIKKDFIWEKLRDLRIAQLQEYAKLILIRKYTNFYHRIAIDEIIFLENKQIQNYIIDQWNDDDNDEIKMNEIEYKVRYALRKNNRQIDIPKIDFREPIDKQEIITIKSKLNDINSEELVQPLINLCDEILECDNPFEKRSNKETLDNLLYFNSNCFADSYDSIKIKDDESIVELKRRKAIDYFKNQKQHKKISENNHETS